MGIKDILNKFIRKDDDLKQAEKEYRIQRLVEQRQKNSNERELERYLEEERQENIKKQLEEFRNKRKRQDWHGNMMKTKNIFKGHKSILTNDMNILKNNEKLFGKGNMLRSSKSWA